MLHSCQEAAIRWLQLLAAACSCLKLWLVCSSATDLQLHLLWCAARHYAIVARPAPAIQPARLAGLSLARAGSSIALLLPERSGGRYSQSAQIRSSISSCTIPWWPLADFDWKPPEQTKEVKLRLHNVMLVCESSCKTYCSISVDSWNSINVFRLET